VGYLWFDVHGSDLFSVDLSQTINFRFDVGQQRFKGSFGGLGSVAFSFSFGLGDLSLDTGGLLSHFSEDGAVWVKFSHGSSVSEWIGLGSSGSSGLWFGGSDNALDGVGVDDSGQISGGDDFVLQSVSVFEGGGTFARSEVSFQSGESGLGPDAQSTQMTTWGKLSDVQSVDIAHIDTGDVSGGSSQGFTTFINDEQWSSSHFVSSISQFTFTASQLSVRHNSSNIFPKSKGFQQGDGVFGFSDLTNGIVQDQWQLVQTQNSVTSGHNQWWAGGGSDSGGKSVSSLGEVNFSVPSSPGLEWVGHSTFSTHVTESGLTRSVSTRTGNSWNTSNSSTGTPGFGGVSHTSFFVNSMSLSGVFGKLIVNESNDIVSDWGQEDVWHFNFSNDFGWVFVIEN